MKLILFISPHYNKCGETYIFENFFENYKKSIDVEFKVFNYYSEFNHLKKKYLVENPIKINFIFRFLEQKFSWLYYRIWMILVFFHLQIILPFIINKQKKRYSEVIIVSRMSNIAVLFVSMYFSFSKNVKFYCSIAGFVYKNSFRKFIWTSLMKKFEGIIIPSNDMINYIKDYTKSSFIFTVPNPVLTDEMKKFKKKKFQFNSKDNFKIICIGRLSYQKGFDVLIKSLNCNSNISLDIIGEGEDREKLMSLTKDLKLNSKIKFLGWKEHPWKLFKNYHLFVMPSRWEGPGHTVIEALAQNIPVLVSDCFFGPIDTIKKGKFGGYFKSENSTDLQTKISKIKNNYSFFVKKAAIGGTMIRKKYSTKEIIKKYTKIFI